MVNLNNCYGCGKPARMWASWGEGFWAGCYDCFDGESQDIEWVQNPYCKYGKTEEECAATWNTVSGSET